MKVCAAGFPLETTVTGLGYPNVIAKLSSLYSQIEYRNSDWIH